MVCAHRSQSKHLRELKISHLWKGPRPCVLVKPAAPNSAISDSEWFRMLPANTCLQHHTQLHWASVHTVWLVTSRARIAQLGNCRSKGTKLCKYPQHLLGRDPTSPNQPWMEVNLGRQRAMVSGVAPIEWAKARCTSQLMPREMQVGPTLNRPSCWGQCFEGWSTNDAAVQSLLCHLSHIYGVGTHRTACFHAACVSACECHQGSSARWISYLHTWHTSMTEYIRIIKSTHHNLTLFTLKLHHQEIPRTRSAMGARLSNLPKSLSDPRRSRTCMMIPPTDHSGFKDVNLGATSHVLQFVHHV